jgi:hypothetical protein
MIGYGSCSVRFSASCSEPNNIVPWFVNSLRETTKAALETECPRQIPISWTSLVSLTGYDCQILFYPSEPNQTANPADIKQPWILVGDVGYCPHLHLQLDSYDHTKLTDLMFHRPRSLWLWLAVRTYRGWWLTSARIERSAPNIETFHDREGEKRESITSFAIALMFID